MNGPPTTSSDGTVAPDARHDLESEAALRGVYAKPPAAVIDKTMDRFDAHARRFIALSPFFLHRQQPAGGAGRRVAARRGSRICAGAG